MLSPSLSQKLPIESLLACLGVLFALFFAYFDIRALHPGVSYPDELYGSLGRLQLWREGAPFHASFGKGSLQGLAQMLLLGLLGPQPLVKHLPNFLALVVESACLFILGKRLFSEGAGFFAVAVNALAAFSLLKLRSLLSYSFTSAELLLLLVAMPACRGRIRPFFWGLASALCLLDYEAWLLALPVLALGWAVSAADARPSLKPALAGLVTGIFLVALWSWPEWGDYLEVRRAQSLGGSRLGTILESLKGYWIGAAALPYTGVRHWPAFPLFAWPALALGIYGAARKSPWVLGWIAIGFIPLISLNSAAEPQRMITAWPALCLLAGAGFDQARRRWSPALIGITLLFVLGAGSETAAYLNSMRANYASSYGYSAGLLKAARALSHAQGPWRLITDLNNDSGAAERFLLFEGGLRSQGKDAAPVAIVPLEYTRGLDKQGRLEMLQALPGAPPVLLFYPSPKILPRLESIEAVLGVYWRDLPPYQGRKERVAAAEWLFRNPKADPWLRSVFFERTLGQSLMAGELPLDLVAMMEKADLQSVSGLVWAAHSLKDRDPAWSERLLKRAAAHGK